MKLNGIARKVAAVLGVAATSMSLAAVTAPQAAAESLTPAEANADQQLAYRAADGFWRTHWSQVFTGSYASPVNVGLYDSRQGAIPCAGVDWTSNNAWYCATTDSVGFDLVFMQRVFELGDSFIYFVVAHEWGHAIQARLADNLKTAQFELQADCFAGAALSGASRDGFLQFEAGDEQELLNSLNSVADKYPWTKVGDHGSAAQRIAAFRQGFDGPAACLPR